MALQDKRDKCIFCHYNTQIESICIFFLALFLYKKIQKKDSRKNNKKIMIKKMTEQQKHQSAKWPAIGLPYETNCLLIQQSPSTIA
jgi:hypothetical protein